MANYCMRCGIPLVVGNNTDYCNEHGGPAIEQDARIRCPFCKEVILVGATKCRYCGEFLNRQSSKPVPEKVAPNLTWTG